MILFLPLVERLYRKHKIQKKRLKLQKTKRKVLNSKILNNPLYCSTADKSQVMITIQETIQEDAEQVVPEGYDENLNNGDIAT